MQNILTVEVKEASIVGFDRFSMYRDCRDLFILDNGVKPCVETPRSKRLNREIHPHAAPAPSVKCARGGKARGKDEAE